MTAVSTRGSSPHSLRFRYGARGDALGRRPPAPRRWAPSQPSAEAPESAGSRYPQLGNAHFDGAGPDARGFSPRNPPRSGFPIPAPSAAGRQSHHLAQQIGGVFSTSVRGVHHVVRHRWFLESGWCRNPTLTDESSVTTASRPPATALLGTRVRAALLYRATPTTGDTPPGWPCP